MCWCWWIALTVNVTLPDRAEDYNHTVGPECGFMLCLAYSLMVSLDETAEVSSRMRLRCTPARLLRQVPLAGGHPVESGSAQPQSPYC